jgi:hypothetical protein
MSSPEPIGSKRQLPEEYKMPVNGGQQSAFAQSFSAFGKAAGMEFSPSSASYS